MIDEIIEGQVEITEGPRFEWKGNQQTIVIQPASLTSTKQLIKRVISGRNCLRPISIIEKLSTLSKPVAYINIIGFNNEHATGFMITDDILITNNHVFPTKEYAEKSIISFNFQKNIGGQDEIQEKYQCDTSFFFTNQSLDYSLVKIHGNPGGKWGVIDPPEKDDIFIGDDIFIIQHPSGQHKQIALSYNVITYKDNNIVQYLTDTLPGSSGSPVFNDSMRLVALHHSGGFIENPSTGKKSYCNEGIRISAIFRDIHEKCKEIKL